MGGALMIGTLYYLQIQPIYGKPFLLEHSIIPCIKMVSLKSSVYAYGDEFVELQSIIRKDYKCFDSDLELIQHFECIYSNIFTYVDIWDEEIITSQAYRLFRRNIQEEKLYIYSRIIWFRSISIILSIQEIERKWIHRNQ